MGLLNWCSRSLNNGTGGISGGKMTNNNRLNVICLGTFYSYFEDCFILILLVTSNCKEFYSNKVLNIQQYLGVHS